MPLYFAYGLNMDRAGMAERCPGAKPVGPARFPRHRFIVTTDGYASAIRDAREEVHGVLWECSLGEIRVLDKFEELVSGLSVKLNQPVIVPGGARRALIYIGRSGTIGRARPGYMESVIAAAKDWALPAAYIAGLTRFLSNPAMDFRPGTLQPAEGLPPGPVAGVRPRAASPQSTLPPRPPKGEHD